MEKIVIVGTDHAIDKEGQFINLSSIGGIEEPLRVRCNYGWKSNKPQENYIIYPPFKVVGRHARTIYTLGVTEVECSKIERIEEDNELY